MSHPGVTVLVDARNVLRSTWPNIPEAEVVELCGRWAREHGVRLVAVFDGTAPAEGATENVEVVGTGRTESADEWLARAAQELADEGRRFWLVTSDRELRAAAGARSERIVGSGRFVRELQGV